MREALTYVHHVVVDFLSSPLFRRTAPQLEQRQDASVPRPATVCNRMGRRPGPDGTNCIITKRQDLPVATIIFGLRSHCHRQGRTAGHFSVGSTIVDGNAQLGHGLPCTHKNKIVGDIRPKIRRHLIAAEQLAPKPSKVRSFVRLDFCRRDETTKGRGTDSNIKL